jgi:response regulator RpfG family c-di-GMP phosphodiesterase
MNISVVGASGDIGREVVTNILDAPAETHFDPEIIKVFVELKEDFRAIREEMKD